jgi:hypothetical protein
LVLRFRSAREGVVASLICGFAEVFLLLLVAVEDVAAYYEFEAAEDDHDVFALLALRGSFYTRVRGRKLVRWFRL